MLKFSAPFKSTLFVCTQKRPDGHPKPCCANRGGVELRQQLKDMVQEKGMEMEVKVFSSGCLGGCDQGPMALRYPDGELILGVTPDDVPQILDELVDSAGK